ncbi:hypothetical protein KM043_001644 [Ampulex compressa]|nr:hypothetical protein KM043_001644 [Ampulex compressa]
MPPSGLHRDTPRRLCPRLLREASRRPESQLLLSLLRFHLSPPARGRAGRGALPDGDSDSHDGPRGFARVFHSSPPSFQKRFVLSGRAIDERAIAKLARIKKRSERRVAGTGLERDQGAWPA